MPIVPVSGLSRARSLASKIAQLAFGTPGGTKPARFPGVGDAGGVVAAILEPLECIDKQARNRLTPENAYDSATFERLPTRSRSNLPRRAYLGIKAKKAQSSNF